MWNVLLVDDHQLFRTALRSLISKFEYGTRITFQEAQDGVEGLAKVREEKIDIVLLDIQMPIMNGIDFLKAIQHDHIKPRVIVLTQFDEESLSLYLLQLGAASVLLKNCHRNELEKALLEVIVNGKYCSPFTATRMQSFISTPHLFSKLEISPRELQIISLLRDGKSTKEVAKHLNLKPSTIESYRKALMRKTNSKNTVDLISLGYRTGLLS